MKFCNHAKAIEFMNRANELLTQLRAILLPSLPANSRSELARDLFDDAFQSVTAANSVLRSSFCQPAGLLVGSADAEVAQKSKCSNRKRKSEGKRVLQSEDRKKRKLHLWTNVTSIPHIDGHQWRKYGQKRISSEKFSRNYYRCKNSKEQGCQARKTVQQTADNDDPPKFIVCYIMQHTCKTSDMNAVPTICDMNKTQYTVSAGMESKFIRSQEDHKDYTSLTLAKPQSSEENSTKRIELMQFLDSPRVAPDADMAIGGDWEDVLGMMDDMFDSLDEDAGQVVDNEGRHGTIWGYDEKEFFPTF